MKAYIESFENGIDGYITKPFEESLLLAQIESIIKNRDLRQQKFIDGIEFVRTGGRLFRSAVYAKV